VIELDQEAIDIFWSRKTTSGDCWLWTRIGPHRKYPAGQPVESYGHYWACGRSYSVHRLAYELAYGSIPGGLSVLHRCDTPACFNPEHLFLGTHADNMHDKAEKGRVWWKLS